MYWRIFGVVALVIASNFLPLLIVEVRAEGSSHHVGADYGPVENPETGVKIDPRFALYWNTHGGLRVYGYPISEVFTDFRVGEGRFEAQYFERGRLELHNQEDGFAKVLPGRVGAELFERLVVGERPDTMHDGGHPFLTEEGIPPACVSLEVGSVCGPFIDAYFSREFMTVGYPISQAYWDAGLEKFVQWTERARMEYDPLTGQVTWGLVGAELFSILEEENSHDRHLLRTE